MAAVSDGSSQDPRGRGRSRSLLPRLQIELAPNRAMSEVISAAERARTRLMDIRIGIESAIETSEDIAAAAARLERLRWAESADYLVLLNVVADAVEQLLREVAQGSEQKLAALADRLRPVVLARPLASRELRSSDLFPWRVVVSTRSPRFFADALDWGEIGIGITAVRRLSSVRPQARCMEPGGLPGQIGGVIVGPQPSLAVTCGHVASATCRSLHFRQAPSQADDTPDIALLHTETCCFGTVLGEAVAPAQTADIERMILQLDRVIRLPGGPGAGGLIEAVVGLFAYCGGLCRFPSVQLRPRRVARLIPWPPWHWRFSRRGDSGSLVVDPTSPICVGMVVAGSGERTYAHVASALLAYLEGLAVIAHGSNFHTNP